MVGFDDLTSLFQPKWLCGLMVTQMPLHVQEIAAVEGVSLHRDLQQNATGA